MTKVGYGGGLQNRPRAAYRRVKLLWWLGTLIAVLACVAIANMLSQRFSRFLAHAIWANLALLPSFAPVEAVPPPVSKIVFKGQQMDYLLAFGNSYTFVQGTKGHWMYSFIADAKNCTYTPTDLLTNRIVLNVTSAGGPNWVQYYTGCYEGLPYKCPGTKLWDFAFAGADISAELLPLHHDFTMDLDDEVETWDTYARPVLKLDPAKTLVAWWIGINDIFDSAKKKNVYFPNEYDRYMNKYFSLVELVYSRGYRNFLFMGLPPLEKTEANLKAAVKYPSALQISQFQSSLWKHAIAFQKKYATQVKAANFDTYSFLNGVLKNPSAYGITNTNTYCRASAQPDINWNYAKYGCLPINKYFWLNAAHITYPVHKAIAAELVRTMAR